MKAWGNNPSKHRLPPDAAPAYYARLVNHFLKTDYRIEEMRVILDDAHPHVSRTDVEIVLGMRDVFFERLGRRLKRPNAKKNPDLALLIEIVNQGL